MAQATLPPGVTADFPPEEPPIGAKTMAIVKSISDHFCSGAEKRKEIPDAF